MAPADQNLRVLIFGAGAIGTYLGCSLHQSGSSVVFIEKQNVAADLQEGGLKLSLPGETLTIPNPKIATSVELALLSGPFDVAVFALKSFDTAAALQSLAPHKAQLPPFLCLQNGVDNEALLRDVLGDRNVIAGTVTSSVLRRSAGVAVLERQRGIGIAATHPLASALRTQFTRSGLNARLYDRPSDMKWSKLVTNLLANATSAILDIPPIKIFSHPGLFRLEIAQIKETLSVMRAQDIRVVNLPSTPVRLLSLVVQLLPAWLSRPILQRSLGAGRGGKMPSLHIDLKNGRKNSEVDELNGAVLRYGEKLSLPTPTNQLLHQILTKLVNGEIPWSDFQGKPDKLLTLWQAGS